SAFIDLPVAVSPIVVGLALVLVFGPTGWFGPFLERHGVVVIGAKPGMILATAFVSLPLVVRALVPVLEQAGLEQEQAAAIAAILLLASAAVLVALDLVQRRGARRG
ncbi:MAG TPA: hypothetical protein VHC23_08715, partial [Jatrophihabitans sp.]|nr:hypothetical protein [Jatrophihabitans sp.]